VCYKNLKYVLSIHNFIKEGKKPEIISNLTDKKKKLLALSEIMFSCLETQPLKRFSIELLIKRLK